jgi:hypothetical protein
MNTGTTNLVFDTENGNVYEDLTVSIFLSVLNFFKTYIRR